MRYKCCYRIPSCCRRIQLISESFREGGESILVNTSAFASLDFPSDGRRLETSLGRHLSFSDEFVSFERRSGLLVLVINFSLVVTVNRSVLRSSTVRLAGRGFPDADRLCGGFVKLGCGERPLRESRESVEAWAARELAPARCLWFPSLSVVPFVRLSV
jgi:hypothetical protein